MMLACCPTKRRFLEGISSADRARAGRTGAPRIGRQADGEGGAPGGAAPYVIGRARLASSAARGGYVNPASKGASQALWRLPPLHHPRNGARDTAKPRTQLRRENAKPCSVIPGRASSREPGIPM